MHHRSVARRILLPRFVLTELSDDNDPAAVLVSDAREPYFCREKLVPDEGSRPDGKPRWMKHQFNLLPVVVDAAGAPWSEASVYLISCLEGTPAPSMATFASIADDLSAYRRFLDEYDVDWTKFPDNRLARPTYRFNGHLKFSIGASEIAAATARRRMGSVIAFYRWLAEEKVFTPANQPWAESDRYVEFSDKQGFRRTKVVKTTDLRINVPVQDDPYDGTIEDGAKLRPLSRDEQEWLIEALSSIGNTEMTLIHVFALLTGARIQTVLTLRVKDVYLPVPRDPKSEARLPVGHGTGIDTKFDKQMVLHIPRWFCEKLRTYAESPRARKRRLRATGGDHEDQYLFLSRQGVPFYQSKADSTKFNQENTLRHTKSGQAVRQFITERVVPYIRETHGAKHFYYRFHDLRATAGMNWTDYQLDLVAQGRTTLHQAREYVQVRMGHESSETTERYLKFRQRLEQVRRVEEKHEEHLRELCERVMAGLN
ncbi:MULTISPECIES: tyrosine-type recombinase/integrase [Paraburkholderia]|uniref:tyrosine-type recombinase/integrase n=1 Tax=Paraburkholderia TaxID=1822464 RepID=UPI00225AB58F|nr:MULTISPECIES: site-specific integrase [Paraburkholderia]MCX4177508.1 site-specific integrase [Paraburkholderia madseniana]MDQ6465497.1 site-specific integrase [Paraburkholderia madseniana]